MSFVSGLPNPEFIAIYDPYLYVTTNNNGAGAICRINISDPTSINTSWKTQLNTPLNIVIDNAGTYMYLLNKVPSGNIIISQLSVATSQTVQSTWVDLNTTYASFGLAIDSSSKYMYVSKGLNILKINIETASIQSDWLDNDMIEYPIYALAIDLLDRFMYATVYDNSGNTSLIQVQLDGDIVSEPEVLYHAFSYGMTIYNTNIYITSLNGGSISQIDLTNGDLSIWLSGLSQPAGIVAYDSYIYVACLQAGTIERKRIGPEPTTNPIQITTTKPTTTHMPITTTTTQTQPTTTTTTTILPTTTTTTHAKPVPCFIAGTRILTPTGYVPVERIRTSDMVVTSDKRTVPVIAIAFTLEKATAESAPYRIHAGAIGNPHDICLSGGHAIKDAKGVWQVPAHLAKTNHTVKQYGVGKPVTYYHLECPNYNTDNLIAEEMVVESFKNKQDTKGSTYVWNERINGFMRTGPKLLTPFNHIVQEEYDTHSIAQVRKIFKKKPKHANISIFTL